MRQFSSIALWCYLNTVCSAQVNTTDFRVVTKTVSKQCSATFAPLPSLGWVSRDGSTIPFTFSPMPSPSAYPPGGPSPSWSSFAYSAQSSLTSEANLPLTTAISKASTLPFPDVYGSSTSASRSWDPSTASATTSGAISVTRLELIGGTPVTATFAGGFITTFTSGGTTSTIVEEATPTASSDVAGSGPIGPCPGSDGKAVQDAAGEEILVVCGTTFSGGLISMGPYSRMLKRDAADDCGWQCQSTTGCIGYTFSAEQCTFYDSIFGTRAAAVPAFSALRLENATISINNTEEAVPPSPASMSPSTVTSISTPLPSTQLITVTLPASSFAYTTTAVSTLLSTAVLTETQILTRAESTTTSLREFTTTLPASTSVSTQVVTITVPESVQNSTQLVTQDPVTLVSTVLVPATLPPATQVVITTVLSVVPASTLTTTLEQTLPGSTVVLTSLVSGETFTLTTTAPGSVEQITVTSIFPGSNIEITRTATSLIPVTATLPAVTYTASPGISISTVYSVLPPQTATVTHTSVGAVSTAFATITSVQPASTITSLQTFTETRTATYTEPTTITTERLSISTVITSVAQPTATLTFTSLGQSTVYVTSISSLPPATITREVTYTQIQTLTITEPTTIVQTTQSISTYTSIQPQATLTVSYTTLGTASTIYLTSYSVLPASTVTSEVTYTLTQPTTIVSTQLSVSTFISIRPASTFTTTYERTYVETQTLTLPGSTITTTQSARTETITSVSTRPAETSTIQVTITTAMVVPTTVTSEIDRSITRTYVSTSLSISVQVVTSTIPASTITTTYETTLPGTTVVSVSSAPGQTRTSIIITTASASVQTVTATITQAGSTTRITRTITSTVANPTPTLCNNQGVQWAQFNDAGDYTVDFIKAPNGQYNQLFGGTAGAVSPVIGGFSYDGGTDTTSIYGQTITSTYYSLDHRGYMFAPYDGIYLVTFSNVDDQVAFWYGDNAKEGWTNTNADFRGSGTIDITLLKGQYLPIRVVYWNGPGGGGLQWTVRDPYGAVVINSAELSPLLLRYSCDRELAPVFTYNFGYEV